MCLSICLFVCDILQFNLTYMYLHVQYNYTEFGTTQCLRIGLTATLGILASKCLTRTWHCIMGRPRPI